MPIESAMRVRSPGSLVTIGAAPGRAQPGFRSELRQRGGELNAERVPAGLRGGVGGDDYAVWLQGKQQCLAGPVEDVLDVYVPVAA